ncbi:LCP family protein [Actinopolymorpha sp. B17G11]|uniref:LCP family protein n=1 Tax=unclassified Actinopolymorpha TaxID=2627063 RepID=UPI0032D97A5E
MTGASILLVFVSLCAVVGYFALTQPRAIVHLALRPDTLLLLAIVLPLIGLAWAATVVATYLVLRPSGMSVMHRIAAIGVVTVLVAMIAVPFAVGGRYAWVQKDLVEHVFAGSTSKSATRPTTAPRAVGNPWKDQGRVNVLLLGSDAGPDRSGVRPDTIILASIDTRTGATVMFSVPRNLQKIPFPAGSAPAQVYPNGTYAGPGNELEWLINSVYRNVPAQHPDLLDSDNPGADATKLAVSGALGVPVDYYAMVNLEGFKELIDALGGITVNVNHRVAMGGEADAGLVPGGWIEQGPNQHLDGFDALWFARGRYGADDYQRMGRQRCVIKAIIDQADPLRVLTRYEALAASSRDLFSTDIPHDLLPAFADLAWKVKGADVTSIAFTNEVIRPSNPDYQQIHELVQNAIKESTTKKSKSSITDSLDNACAYHPDKGGPSTPRPRPGYSSAPEDGS